MKRQFPFLLTFAALLVSQPGGGVGKNAAPVTAQPSPATTATATPAATSGAADTGRNVRDKSGATLTPVDQKESRSDRKITAAIRRAVVKDDSLSLDAHNAKIITRDGTVTLRGPVKNGGEKSKLQSIAEKTRGVKHVDNQLEPTTP